MNKNGKEAKMMKSLTENLFNIRIGIIQELQILDYQTDEYTQHRHSLIEGILKETKGIDESKFSARMKLQFIHKFNQESAFECLSDADVRELEDHVAPLLLAIDDDGTIQITNMESRQRRWNLYKPSN